MSGVVTLGTVRYTLVKNGGKVQVLTGGAVGPQGPAGTGGSGAAIAGSNTQVQFNDGGAFGASSNFTWDKATNTLTVGGALAISGGTVTTSKPLGDHSQTWNAAGVTFTAWKVNITDTASAAGSKLLDLQVGGASQFQVDKAGGFLMDPVNSNFGIGSDQAKFGKGVWVRPGTNDLYFKAASSLQFGYHHGYGFELSNLVPLCWSPTGSDATANADTFLYRGGAGILEQRNGANAQTFRLYNTYTDASNFERASLRWNLNEFQFFTDAIGTGTARDIGFYPGTGRSLYLGGGANARWQVSATGHLLGVTDNSYDIGASGATRPRTGYFGTSVVTPAVAFPATQVASADPNTLDDYEEGTFTPTLTFGGASTGVAYSVQSGSYTKVGNAVAFRLTVILSSKGSATGVLQINGLPFSVSGTCSVNVVAFGLTGVTSVVQGAAITSTSAVRLYDGYGSPSQLTDAKLTNSTELEISGIYFT